MARFYNRSTCAVLLAGVLSCFVPASNVCGAVCNPAPGEETELKTFTVKDGANPANKAVVDTGIPGSNPGKLYICGDTANIQMDATVSPLAARRQYVGWRIEKETGAGNLMDTPHANPNQGNVAVALPPPLFPGNESSLTVGAPEIRQFYVKAFCDGDKNGQKDAGEDFYYDTDGKVIEVQVVLLKVELDIWNGGSDLDNGDATGSQGAQVPDGDEETVGGFLLLNWDDDNSSGGSSTPVPDLTESGTVANEDNLAQLKPNIEPLLDVGTVELEVSGADAGKIKLWTSSTKGTPVSLTANKKIWDLSNSAQKSDFQTVMANSLWIEGIDAGTAKRAVTFDLRYKQGTTTVCEDKTKATVVFMRLGSAVYRELDIQLWKDLGHGAIFYRFKTGVALTEANIADAENYQVVHSMSSANGPTIDVYTNISDHPTAPHWVGCYESPNLSYVDRLNILKGGKALYDLRASIDYPPGVADDVLVTTSGGVDTWNGAFSDIEDLRCDGFIEVIYEKPGTYISDVWGELASGVWRYAISLYATYHNDQDYTWGYSNNFNPGTQSGYTTPTGDTQTKFQYRQWVVEPAIIN